mmetsp:Transcript_12043/g.18168  ORF Transcript_12043/g.18168 Transcript_12043/m.18168 type:complete len:205 (-) Transcript_12043:345-959(-)
MVSPISPSPFQSFPTRSEEKIGNRFFMCTLSIAHMTSSLKGLLLVKKSNDCSSWSMLVCPTSVVVTSDRCRLHRNESSVNDIPAPFAITAYSLIASCAASDRYLYSVLDHPNSSILPRGFFIAAITFSLSSLSNAAGRSMYFPVSIPPARALYAMNPTFSLYGDDASATPFSSLLRSINEKSPWREQGGVTPRALAVRVHPASP